ncbi:MAG: bifunctional folylpolyglutamate synthase/dihydrofolate synthase [Candidatus Omnitrophica bacterium]|nr:bifunctional folylpolyglutamate synthase/dihydrofolate synthase [Candidatus Omnitrophota bacterium]
MPLKFLDSFLNYEQVVRYRYPEAFSLDRMEQLLERLGNPHRVTPTLHVAGTKGKGSTCAFTAGILQSAGLKVGLYTSPHLVSFRERIQVNGEPISEEALSRLAERIRPFAGRDLTYFEVTTALAFLHFSDSDVEAAVIEVGLGGRLDATNTIEPEVCGIAPVSLDHMEKLGFSIGGIAGEKAGIIKPGVPAVIAPQPPEALNVLRKAAFEKKAPFHQVEEEVQTDSIRPDRMGTSASFKTPEAFYSDLRIPLLGRHQLINAAVALRMSELFFKRRGGLSAQALRRGLSGTFWPGRAQLLEGSPPVLLDGAQNAASAQALKEACLELFPKSRVHLIVGVSLEKDLQGIASVWGPWAKSLTLTRAPVPRAESPERIARAFRAWFPQPRIAASVPEALELARAQAQGEGMIVVTGSLFVVGEALKAMGAEPSACAAR